MPGTLQVGGNTVITHTGDAGAGTNTINSAVVFPAGHIIQFKHATSNTEVINNTGSYVSLTAFDLQITPTQSNSKLLIILAGHLSAGTSNNITVEMVNEINSSNSMSWVGNRTNTNAIVERSEQAQFHRIYEHGQTSSFTININMEVQKI